MTTPHAPSRLSSHPRLVLWLTALAVAVRLVYFAEHSGSAFFSVPVLDGTWYDTAARALAEEHPAPELMTGFRPLLYPLWLAGFYRLADPWGMAAALAAQHVLGVLAVLLVAALALRLFHRPAAAALAGGLYALAGPPLYFEGELLTDSLFTFLALLALWLFTRAETAAHRAALGWLAAGLGVGLAAEVRANALLFLLALPLAVALAPRDERRRRGVLAAATAAGCLVVLVGFGLWQWPLFGRFQLLPGAGGVNLYLGNERGADGRVPRQDRPVAYGEQYRDSVEVFAEEVYREQLGKAGKPVSERPDPAAVSRFWTRRALAEIAADPLRWAGLMLRKTWFLAWNREIPNNQTYAFVLEHESRFLRLLPVRWWLLFALAPLGLALAWRRGDRRGLLWLAAFLTLHALGVVLFFVNARYRLPLWPGMAVAAAGGLVLLGDTLRERAWRRLTVMASLVAAFAAVSLVNWLGVPDDSFARDFFFRSVARLERGELEGAFEDARRSVELDPEEPAARFQLGNVALALGDDHTALDCFRRVVQTRPEEPRVWNNLGIVLERLSRPEAAYNAYRRALDVAAGYGPALVNAALLELRRGALELAAGHLDRARAASFDSLQMTVAEAALAARQGREAEAAALLEKAKRQDPELAARLWQELR